MIGLLKMNTYRKGSNMRRYVFPLFILACLLLPMGLYSADTDAMQTSTQYDLGSQMFTFTAGPVIPLFFYFPYDDEPVVTDMHLYTGGYGSIRYQGFLNRYLAIGGELGYAFAYDRSEELLTSVPIQLLLSYIPLQGQFELPISLGLGCAYNSYDESNYLSLFASAQIGFSYFFKEEWGLNISGGYWLIPELYSNDKLADTCLSNFLPITVSIIYRH